MTRLTLLFCLPLLVVVPALGQEKKPSAAGIAFFETNVRPVLVNRCFECHGPKKHKGDLRLDSLAGFLEGGKSGPALVVGRPEHSLFIQAIRHGETLQMPPRMKLPAKEIADLTAWVKMGAPWPDAKPVTIKNPASGETEPVFSKEKTEHWAFQRVRKPTVPAVKNAGWVRSPIDAFVLARLEEKGLAPAPAAEARVLVRRLYFDLLGLPPTPEEVDGFLKECGGRETINETALEKLVERLLASPRYGERWARHWLDLVRYADSNGMDENLVFGNAWRYRDYVIRAFNDDKPYDQFVREQIAGDLLPFAGPLANGDGLVATGFLCIGPKMLAEDDPVKMEMDIIDEQLDSVGRTFLGLTLGCARCHDHKYDPFAQTDYYSLAGIFKSTKTMDNFRVVARWQERPIATPADVDKANLHARKITELKEAITRVSQRHYEDLVKPARQRAGDYLQAALALQKSAPTTAVMNKTPFSGEPKATIIEAEDFARGNVLKSSTSYGEKIGVICNKGELPNFAEYDIDVKQAGVYQLELRYAAAQARPVKVTVNGALHSANAAGKVTGTWFPDTQTWFAEGLVTLRPGKNIVRLERAEPFPHFDKLALVPAPPGVKSLEQWAHDAHLDREFLKQWLEFLRKNSAPKDAADLEKIGLDPKGPFRFTSALEVAFPAAAQKELAGLRNDLAALEKSVPMLPEAMAASEGKPVNLRVHLRGNHLTQGKEAPRRFPVVFQALEQPAVDAKNSGRMQLAHWLTQPQHPLTSRVMVNRLWHWHMGAGLVRSVDNFGLLGERPTHPELLDWLADRFVASGWSVKAMHRLIVLSSTYRMSSTYNEAAFGSDPDNRLHWRRQRCRLEAEALRDSLYALAGNLDLAMGGTVFEGENRKYVPGYPNNNYAKYDARRRSVYLPVVRSDLYDMFQAFDFADPSFGSGDRATTTVAPQALFLMNGKIVHEQTRLWVTKLLADHPTDDARVRRIYAQALGRSPTEGEVTRSLDFIRRIEAERTRTKTADARVQAWQSLCRVLVSTNEFVYVE